ncbi:MAG: CoA transferase [Deltaproteobacteria bacterium]|nr:CoA transferase [Deltaproteobacteria bacterium]
MRPLDGVRVLDLSRVLAGPYCTLMLADMGAEVIKVEHPKGGDETRRFGPPFVGSESAYFLSINHGKRSIAIDFKHPDGLALVKRLAAISDVVVENFRPGVLAKLGLGERELLEQHPRLIYVSITGFGHSGDASYVSKPGYDPVLQCMGGIASLTGPADGMPYKAGASIADVVGGIYGAYGTVLALLARDRTGRGQHVDVSMLDGQVSLLAYHAGAVAATGRPPTRYGNSHPTIVPYKIFEAADGWVVIGAANDKFFGNLARLLGHEEWLADPRFASNPSRVENRDALVAQIDPIIKTRTVQDWLETLEQAGVPAGPVLDVAQVMRLPHLRAREMVVEVNHPTAGPFAVTGVPVKLSDTPGRVDGPPPLLGADTDQVLNGLLQLDAAEIARLRAAGAIG